MDWKSIVDVELPEGKIRTGHDLINTLAKFRIVPRVHVTRPVVVRK